MWKVPIGVRITSPTKDMHSLIIQNLWMLSLWQRDLLSIIKGTKPWDRENNLVYLGGFNLISLGLTNREMFHTNLEMKQKEERFQAGKELNPPLLALKTEDGSQEPGNKGGLWKLGTALNWQPTGQRVSLPQPQGTEFSITWMSRKQIHL